MIIVKITLRIQKIVIMIALEEAGFSINFDEARMEYYNQLPKPEMGDG